MGGGSKTEQAKQERWQKMGDKIFISSQKKENPAAIRKPSISGKKDPAWQGGGQEAIVIQPFVLVGTTAVTNRTIKSL